MTLKLLDLDSEDNNEQYIVDSSIQFSTNPILQPLIFTLTTRQRGS